LRLAKTAAERDQIWFARKSAFGAIAQISPAFLIVDGTVPRSKLAATLGKINRICARHSLRVGYVFHAGDGNLHPLILFDPSDAEMVHRVHLAGREVLELCVAQGGTITGEHGVGSEKLGYMTLMYNAGELQAMRDIKQVFDPQDLVNPAKIIPDEPIYLPDRRAPKAEVPSYAAPVTVEEAADLMKDWAAAATAPKVRIRGGGTKSALLGPTDAVLSTRNLRGIQEYSRNDLYVTVRAGTPLTGLQAELARDKVWVPLASPWAESTIGGIVATNFNAPLRMRYGSLRDLILAITAVLPDGRVVRAGRPVVKNVAGYDLVKLFIGSHGTLGLLTDVTFKLLPFPRARSSVIVPLNELAIGLKLAAKLLKVCLVASSLLLCRGCQLPGVSAPYALVYTAEGVPEDVAAEFGQVGDALKDEGVTPPPLLDGPAGSEVWASWLNQACAADMMLRVGVPPKDAPAALVDLAPTLEDAPFIADLAFGLIWTQDGSRNVSDRGLDVVRGIAKSLGGYAVVLSARNIPDSARFNPWDYAPDGLDLMRGLKARWNPRDFCNPGAFVV
jgi:D-lactate dehydrogenase (cytochrome)